MYKKLALSILTIVILAGGYIFWYLDKDTQDKYESGFYDEAMIPRYEQITVPFRNEYDSKKSIPIVGSAIIDINQDGIDEIFIGGGRGQSDGLFEYNNGKFFNITDKAGLSKDLNATTYGAAVIDMDQDSIPDLLVARDNAVWMYLNKNGLFGDPIDLSLEFNEKSQPLSITIADLNRDGWADLFVSTYLKKHLMEGQTIFNKEGYGSTSQLFLNLGNNVFENITEKAGLEYVHNTFCAVFVDLNNDGLADLVVAHDTGEPRIYRNDGDLTFSMITHPLTGLYSYPMGIAVGDYDQNGFQDVFFSNVGQSLPLSFMRGDLRKDQTLITDWILLANRGNFEFEDVAESTKVANYEFSWGAVFEDFNLDGLQDLVVSENYVDLPNSKIRPLPSRFLMQLDDHTFTNIESKNNTLNPCNGITPLVSDFNDDGYPDLVHVNLGGDVKAFISKGNTGNNYLKVKLPESPAYINASVILELEGGKKLYAQNVIGEGLASDQTHTLFFGLGKGDQINSVLLKLTNGFEKIVEAVDINKTMYLK